MSGGVGEDVELVIELPDPDGVDRTALETAVQGCVADVARDLELPLAIPATVSLRTGARLRVSVGGRRVRLIATGHVFRLQPSSVEEQICDSIRGGADQLVTAEVVARIWEPLHVPGSEPPPPGFADLVTQLVRIMVRPSRLDGLVSDWSALDPAFEAALNEASGPLVTFVDRDTYEAIRPEWSEKADFMADGLFVELGLILGAPALEVDPDLPPHHFAIRVNDCRAAPRLGLRPDEALVNDTSARLGLMNVAAKDAINPATGQPAAVVDADHTAMLEAAGLTTWGCAGYLILTLAAVARRHAAALYSSDVLGYQLDTLEPWAPATRRLVERIGGTDRLVRVLRRLLAEQVSIRNLGCVLRTLHQAPVLDFDHNGVRPVTTRPALRLHTGRPGDEREHEAALAEVARAGLARQLSHQVSRGTETVAVYLVAPSVDARLLDSEPLSDAEQEALLDMVLDEMNHLPPTALRPSILTSTMIRSRLRDAIAVELPTMAVVSYDELSADLNVQPVARLEFTELLDAPGA